VWKSINRGSRSETEGKHPIATVHSMDVVVPVKRANTFLSLRLRTIAKPDQEAATLLAILGLRLPRGSKFNQNAVEKIAEKSRRTPSLLLPPFHTAELALKNIKNIVDIVQSGIITPSQ
jgi:hypothetical protein